MTLASKRVGIYCRVSTEEQAGRRTTSLDEQEWVCRSYADRRDGWQVVRVYREAFTGTADDRPAWTRLLMDADELDACLCLNIDRFTRDELVSKIQQRELADLGVELWLTTTGRIDLDDDTSRLTSGILGEVAAYQRRALLRTMARGAYGKARRGGWPSSPAGAPFGLAVEGTRKDAILVEDPQEMATGREAARLVLDEGLDLAAASRVLNAQGMLPRRSALWTSTLLKAMLSDPVRYGYLVWGKPQSNPNKRGATGKYGDPVEIPGVPAMFDRPTWDRLQAVIARTRRPDRAEERVYPLSLRLVSPCGLPMTGISRNDLYAQYRCRGTKWQPAHDWKSCGCRRLRADAIESRVWAEVTALLGDPDRLAALATEHLATVGVNANTPAARVDQLDRAIAQLKGRMDTAVARWIRMGKDPADLAGAYEQLDREVTGLIELRDETQRQAENAQAGRDRVTSLVELADRARDRLASANLQEQAELLALLDVRVTVLDGEKVPALRIEGVVADDVLCDPRRADRRVG